MIVELSAGVVLGIAVGGALGTVLRFLLDVYVPAGVWVANVAGSLLLGWLLGAGVLSETATSVLAVGFIGALSTFATVSLRATQLWMQARQLRALGLWAAHVLCGLAAAAAGMFLAAL